VEWELEEEKARQEAEARGEDFDRLKWLQLTAADADRIIEKKKRKAENVEKGFAGMARF
jgi:pre-mRNA-splicing factor SYF2